MPTSIFAFPDEQGMVFEAYTNERARQDAKWGSQRHLPPEMWMTILTEEVGEAAKEVLEQDPEKLRTELVQCGAVITAWLEALNEGR